MVEITSTSFHQTDIIRILLRNGAAVEAKARERQTPLHIASRLGNVDIAVLLLQHGADVRAITADHYNALHIAAKQHNHDVSIEVKLQEERAMEIRAMLFID